MYCPSCGATVTRGLNYCNRCGGSLSVVKGDGAKEPAKSSAESIGEEIFWTTVFGLGLIFGGMIALKKSDVREALIIAYMVISSLAFIGLYALDVWRFIRVHRGPQETGPAARADSPDTKELDAAHAPALPEPATSVTEGTTRTLEPSYVERKTR